MKYQNQPQCICVSPKDMPAIVPCSSRHFGGHQQWLWAPGVAESVLRAGKSQGQLREPRRNTGPSITEQ